MLASVLSGEQMLRCYELCVVSAPGEQVRVRATFDQFAALHNQDQGCIDDRREALGNHDAGVRQFSQGSLYASLCQCV